MSETFIKVEIAPQLLTLYQDERAVRRFSVSTAAKGVGEINGSEKTPRGKHEIYAKVGENCPVNTVFKERKPTGEIYSPELAKQFPQGRDWILTRILWLSGLEAGKNRGGEVDTLQRCIYIHGCPDDARIDIPLSRGCVRMRNKDLLELFDLVEVGTKMLIIE
jgi:L,D-transpeptidase YbiS